MSKSEHRITAEEISELCQSCAMCCDGTLFSKVELSAADAAAVQETGVQVVRGSAPPPILEQPCAALCETTCSIYAARPKTCRSFACRVVRKIEQGRLTLASGKDIIQTACSLRDSLVEQLGDHTVFANYRAKAMQLDKDWPSLDLEERRRNAPALQLFTALEEVLEAEVRPAPRSAD